MKKYKKWTKKELDFIAENCDKVKDSELAQYLCVTVDMIRRQRRNLKIRKKRGRPCLNSIDKKDTKAQL